MNLAKKGTIISIQQIAERTIRTAIKVPEDFNFIAGQYIWLAIPQLKYPDPRGNTRMFSIVSSPNKKGMVDIIFRTGQSGYKKTLMEMPPGAEILFSGPYGPLRLPEDTSVPIVFIAGGVGVAPFLSMIRFFGETHSGHTITLVYANMSEQEAAYLDELVRIEKGNPSFKLFGVFGLLREHQLNGSVGNYIGKRATWLVMGPRGLVNFVEKYLNKRGVPREDIVFEQFYPDLPLRNG